MFVCMYVCTYNLYRLHPVVCVISYDYDCQHKNKAEYLRVKTKTNVDKSYVFNISMDFLLHFSTCDLGHHELPSMIYNPRY
jgi:hypothetical protein